MLKRCASLLCLLVALTTTCAAAPEQWIQVGSPHFIVYTDAGEKQGRHILDQFERMRWVFRTLFPKLNADPPTPIRVFACRNGKSFEALEPAVYLGKGQMKLAGLFQKMQDSNYVLLRLDTNQEEHPFATIYHEYTHMEFSSIQEWLPVWLNEGLAQFFEYTDIHNKDVTLGQPSGEAILFLRQTKLIPLPVLFKVDASSPYYHEENKSSIFYAESWALTHMIQVSDARNHTQHLHDYMVRLADHEDAVTAATEVFGDLKKFESSLAAYIGYGSYNQFVMNSAAAPIDESSYTVQPLTAPESDVDRADVLAAVGRLDDARTLLDSVIKQDPNSSKAYEIMGELAYRRHDTAEALKWYSQAIHLNSTSYLAHYYFAQTAMAHGSADPAQIESSLRQAIQLNPSFAPAYNQLAMYYGMHHQNLEEAQSLITQAVKLDPGQFVYRFNAVNILMARSNFDGAQKVLDACLKLARNPQQVDTVQSRLAQLKQIQAAMANRASAPTITVEEPSSPRVIQVTGNAAAPKHPTEPPTGAKHVADGVMRQVTCSYPAVLEFQVQTATATVSVYTNNFYKLDVSALGFTPTGDMYPCSDFEGKKARVEYAEVSDKTVAGQVLSVELHK